MGFFFFHFLKKIFLKLQRVKGKFLGQEGNPTFPPTLFSGLKKMGGANTPFPYLNFRFFLRFFFFKIFVLIYFFPFVEKKKKTLFHLGGKEGIGGGFNTKKKLFFGRFGFYAFVFAFFFFFFSAKP